MRCGNSIMQATWRFSDTGWPQKTVAPILNIKKLVVRRIEIGFILSIKSIKEAL